MRYPFDKHFAVCTGDRCNARERGEECGLLIRDLIKDENKRMGRKPAVRVTSVSCLDLCDHGPNMIVWPEGTVYSHLTRETGIAAYRAAMGDGPPRPDLELSDAEFGSGGSAAAKK